MKVIMKLAHLAMLAAVLATPVSAETPVAPEVNPPGDIPDNQVFIDFVSPNGFAIKIPEGWARKDDGATTTFNDKYNHIVLTTVQGPTPNDQTALVHDVLTSGRAVADISAKSMKAAGSTALVITYSSNSEPNAVTNKQVREENEKLIFAKADRRVEVTLSAPKGADNVDQWNLIAKSFRWK